MHEAQIVVLAKAPVAGRSKTRLCPALTPQHAADVARAALLDTIDAVVGVPVRRRVLVLDGAAEDLATDGLDVLPQRGAGLDERLAHAFEDAFATCPVPTLLVGMDSPQVTSSLLAGAVEQLLSGDSVLGHAADGGWWALGLVRPDAEVFLGVPMSADDTGERQERRLRQRGLRPCLLPVLRDIDRIEDLVEVAGIMPRTSRVAQITRSLTERVA